MRHTPLSTSGQHYHVSLQFFCMKSLLVVTSLFLDESRQSLKSYLVQVQDDEHETVDADNSFSNRAHLASTHHLHRHCNTRSYMYVNLFRSSSEMNIYALYNPAEATKCCNTADF